MSRARSSRCSAEDTAVPLFSPRVGHIAALEHLVPFTPARPLRYPQEKAFAFRYPRSGFHRGAISSDFVRFHPPFGGFHFLPQEKAFALRYPRSGFHRGAISSTFWWISFSSSGVLPKGEPFREKLNILNIYCFFFYFMLIYL